MPTRKKARKNTPAKRQKTLPKRPTLPSDAELQRGSEPFRNFDTVLQSLLRKKGATESFKNMMARSRIRDPLTYARRCIIIAGIDAWQTARAWQDKRAITRAHVGLIRDNIAKVKAATATLRNLALRIKRVGQQLPKASDPTILGRVHHQESMAENLLGATELIQTVYDEFDTVDDELDRYEFGRQDPLSVCFIRNLKSVWRLLFGSYPPTGRMGSFVTFADAAWEALGWSEDSTRQSLGKKIFEIGRTENWSLLNDLNSRLAGTRE
jgi:hypothetical protein